MRGDADGFACDAFGHLRACRGTGVFLGYGGVERVACAGAFDELRGPVPADEERIGPFEEDDTRAVFEGVDELCRGEHALAEPRDGFDGLLLEADSAADGVDVVEHTLERLRVEAEDLGAGRERIGDTTDCLQIDRADLAEILREDQIGPEGAEERLVHGVEGDSGSELLADAGVDGGWIQSELRRG